MMLDIQKGDKAMIEHIGSREPLNRGIPGTAAPGEKKLDPGPKDVASISIDARASGKPSKKRNAKASKKSGAKVIYPNPNPGAGVFAEPFGKITHLALQLDGEAQGKVRENVFGAWSTLFKTMDPDVRFTVVLESEADKKEVEELLRKNNIQNPERFNLLVADDINITLWSRDQMVGLFSPSDDTTLLNQTTMRPHGDDPQIPPRIVEANKGIILDPDKRPVTDGGDEISNSRETFLGYNSLYLTAKNLHDIEHPAKKHGRCSPFRYNLVTEFPKGKEKYQVPDFYYEENPAYNPYQGFPDEEAQWLSKAKELFEKKYGKPVTVIGADDPSTPEHEEPATFHIDMGLTPVDDKTMLVGDPRMAIDIIRSLPKSEYDEYNRKLQEELGVEGDVLKSLIDANTADDPLLQHQFDHNADLLRKKGYDIIRMPYLQGPPDVSWVTYNNCLMESFKREDGTEVRRVFLPTFGLPALDGKAEEIYRSQGFEVIPLHLPALTAWRGAIRCISNILGRSPET
jgi:hypothetical protein